MNEFYTGVAEDARVVIEEFGAEITIATTNSDATISTRTKKAVFVETVMKNASSFGDGGVLIGDLKALVEWSAMPVKGDIVRFGSEKYTVVFNDPIRPGGDPVAHYTYLRSA